MIPASSLLGAGEGARQFRPSRAEEPCEPEHLAFAQVEVRIGDAGSDRHALRAEESGCRLRRGVDAIACAEVGDAASEHLLDEIDPQQLRRHVLADEPAAAEDGDAVGDLVDLVEEVRDEDDGDAALLEVADDAEELGHLVDVEARRRLVEHQHPHVDRDRPGDGDELLDGERVASQHRRRIDRQPEPRQHLRGALAHRRPVDGAEAARFATEADVLGHREIRQQIDLLVDRADPRPQRIGRRAEADGIPVEFDAPGIQVQRAGEGLDERRLAGAVLSHEGVHLAREHAEAHVVERGLRAEPYRRPGEFHERTPLVHPAIMSRDANGSAHGTRVIGDGRTA